MALKFFGEHKQKACEEYVERVFREYDVDESGELSYEGTDFSEHFRVRSEQNFTLSNSRPKITTKAKNDHHVRSHKPTATWRLFRNYYL